MFISILVAGIAAVSQGPVHTVAAISRDGARPRQHTIADSVRALRVAHRAQESFEFVRRQYLPRELGVGSHHCDVRIGRWCIWNDETNDRKPPPESPRVTRAREKLLATLDSIATQFPGDEWIAAQRVRYLMEAKRYSEAVRVADECTASTSGYRCRAFAAVALHDSGAVAAADSAFSDALAAMPDSVRCRWTDISVLLDDEIADRYAHADCVTRRQIETTFWRLTTPLYLREGDFRSEFLARVTWGELQRDSRMPMGSPTESAFRETALRYGYDTWFVRDDPPAGSMQEAAVAGYREGGSGYNFVPASAAFTSPADLRAHDWDVELRTARTLYSPSYARHFRPLTTPHISLFRRGDSALVVAAYDVRDDTLLARDPLEAALFAAPVDSTIVGKPDGTMRQGADAAGVLTTMAPWKPMVVSLELLDAKTKSAARARTGVRPPRALGHLGMSDLLLFAPRSADSLPQRLEDAMLLGLRSGVVDRNRILGLFWEMYGVRAEGETFAVGITIERIQQGWMRHAAERLHLATPFSPMELQWTEVPGSGNGMVSRSITLDLSKLDPGRYQITLRVRASEGLPVIATRDITLRR